MIGVFYCPLPYISLDSGFPIEWVIEGIETLVAAKFCTHDAVNNLFWVHETARYQIGDTLKPNDNRKKDVIKRFNMLPEGVAKTGFYERYKIAFGLPDWSPQHPNGIKNDTKLHSSQHVDGIKTPVFSPYPPFDTPSKGLESSLQAPSKNEFAQNLGSEAPCKPLESPLQAPSKPVAVAVAVAGRTQCRISGEIPVVVADAPTTTIIHSVFPKISKSLTATPNPETETGRPPSVDCFSDGDETTVAYREKTTMDTTRTAQEAISGGSGCLVAGLEENATSGDCGGFGGVEDYSAPDEADLLLASAACGVTQPVDQKAFSLSGAVAVPDALPPCPHTEILQLFQKRLPEMPQPRSWDGLRKKELACRWKWILEHKDIQSGDYVIKDRSSLKKDGLEFFDEFFKFISKSDFLTGKDGSGFNCSIGWIVNKNNFTKIYEGNYENNNHNSRKTA